MLLNSTVYFKTQHHELQSVFMLLYKIIWIVRAFWLVYKCVFIALWSTKMTWAMWLSVSKLWEFTISWNKLKYTHALCISSFSLFVGTKNNNFIIEMKHVSLRAFIAGWKTRRTTASCVFTDLLSNSPRRSPRFTVLLSHVMLWIQQVT